MTASALPRAARPLLDFLALLRRNGFPVAPEQGRLSCGAIAARPARHRGHPPRGARHAGAAASGSADFDMLFDMHFLGLAGVLSIRSPKRRGDCDVRTMAPAYRRAAVGRRATKPGRRRPPAEALFAARAAAGRRQPSAARASAAHLPARLPRRRGFRMRSAQARRRLRPAALAARCHPHRRRGHPAAPPRTPARPRADPAADRRVGLDEGAHRRRICASPMRWSTRRPRVEVFTLRHAADPRHPRAAAEATASRRWPSPPTWSPTGTAARGSAMRWPPSSPCRASPPSRAARWCSCCPTGWSAAIRRQMIARGRRSRRARLADRLADAARRRGRYRPETAALRAILPCSTSSPTARPRSGSAGTFSICRDGGLPMIGLRRVRRCPSSHLAAGRTCPGCSGPMQPRIFGPYEPIRRDYPIAEYLADVAGAGVERSVYVQANWAKERFARRGPPVSATPRAKPAGRTPSSPMRT